MAIKSRTPIYHTQEYKLSDSETQRWAFTHKNQYTNSEDAAKAHGVKTKDRIAKVKTNTGEFVDVPVELSWHTIKPTKHQFKHTKMGDKYQSICMIKGSSPKIKSAVYFTQDDFNKSPDVVAFKAEVDEAFSKHHEKHHEDMKLEMTKRLPAMAKLALKELPEVIEKDGVDGVDQWFKKNGFTMLHVDKNIFKNFVGLWNKEKFIVSDWSVSSEPDGWGHQKGVSAKIDFAKKTITSYGWSSDD